jgi:hypothetical protein
MSPSFIVEALTNGTMKAQGAVLSPAQRAALAEFLTGQNIGAEVSIVWRCVEFRLRIVRRTARQCPGRFRSAAMTIHADEIRREEQAILTLRIPKWRHKSFDATSFLRVRESAP